MVRSEVRKPGERKKTYRPKTMFIFRMSRTFHGKVTKHEDEKIGIFVDGIFWKVIFEEYIYIFFILHNCL